MKLQIDFDGPNWAPEIALRAIGKALTQKTAAELLSAYGPGDSFSMNDDEKKVKITLTVVYK